MNRKAGTTIGFNSFAEGNDTTASGYSSHVEGQLSTASGDNTHAEGYQTTASGYNAHAEGIGTIASGTFSHAEGWSTVAKGMSQHVAGRYNVTDDTSARITGWGSSDTSRKNIEQLDSSGNLRLKGSVYVGCNDNSSGGTLIDTEMANKAATSATNAANSASEATSSANLAGTYASRSATSAREAATSASNANTYKDSASSSASAAATSASNANTYKDSAATSATNAANSAKQAATSASNAATSATNAANAVKTALGNIKHIYWSSMTGTSTKTQNDVYNELLATLSADQKTLLSQGKTLRIFCLPYANSVEPAANQTGISVYIDVNSTEATFYTGAIYAHYNNSNIGNKVNSIVMTKGTTSVPSGQTFGDFYFIPDMCLVR